MLGACNQRVTNQSQSSEPYRKTSVKGQTGSSPSVLRTLTSGPLSAGSGTTGTLRLRVLDDLPELGLGLRTGMLSGTTTSGARDELA